MGNAELAITSLKGTCSCNKYANGIEATESSHTETGPTCRRAESCFCLRVDAAEACQGRLPVRGCDGDMAYLPLQSHLCFAIPVHRCTRYLHIRDLP